MQKLTSKKSAKEKKNKKSVSRHLNSNNKHFLPLQRCWLFWSLTGLRNPLQKRWNIQMLAFFIMWLLVRATAARLRVKGKRDLVPLLANNDSTYTNCRLLKSLVGKGALRHTQTWGIRSLVPQWTLWLRCYRLRFKSLISQFSTSQTTLPESSCLIYLETQCVAPLVQFWHNWCFCCCDEKGRIELKVEFKQVPFIFLDNIQVLLKNLNFGK